MGQLNSFLKDASANDLLEALERLIELLDRATNQEGFRRARVVTLIREALGHLMEKVPTIGDPGACPVVKVGWDERERLRPPGPHERVLLIDSEGFASEGCNSVAAFIVKAYKAGWRRIILLGVRGQRFIGSGIGPNSYGLRIDVIGSPGDYLGSGLWGAEVVVHGSAQDQVANIMKDGKIVVHGDVGHTLMYAAKGGEVYVRGSAAGRPFIFTVGSPKLILNGTALDYLGEQCMAGDPLKGGGFAIVNGLYRDSWGVWRELPEPYPGSNLFSLASGGAVYIRDPWRKVSEDQLNEGRIVGLTPEDWRLIKPYLLENERLFGISVNRLLTVDGKPMEPWDVYVKIAPNPESEKLKAKRH